MIRATAPTVVVELTPQGRAAVAVVLVAGSGAREAIRQFFVPVTVWKNDDPPIGRIVLGRWGGGSGEELIVCRRGEDQFEIHCHGGDAAAANIIDQLVSRGCHKLTWQEWVRSPRSRVSPKLEIASRRDAATCSAQTALANAPTTRTAAILLDQYHGALTGTVQSARAAVAAANWKRAGGVIDQVLQFRDFGLHLTSAWRVVLAGAPNVGKSSLMNAIAGYQRAIVSPTPGTTRDVVTVNTAIDGWPVQLADTAGLRETHDAIESAGVALTDVAIGEADLAVVVSDATAGIDVTNGIASRLPDAVRLIHVRNKIDLVSRVDAPNHRNAKLVSALTGEGIANLIAAIGSTLVSAAPPAGAAVAFTAEQVVLLETARQSVLGQNAAAAETALAALLAAG